MRTLDYQNFLCSAFKSTPDLITQIFSEKGDEVLADALEPINWDFLHKCAPNSPDAYTNGEVADFYPLDTSYPKGPLYSKLQKIPTKNIAFEIVFNLMIDRYEGTVAYIVLETTTGELLLGDFVGD